MEHVDIQMIWYTRSFIARLRQHFSQFTTCSKVKFKQTSQFLGFVWNFVTFEITTYTCEFVGQTLIKWLRGGEGKSAGLRKFRGGVERLGVSRHLSTQVFNASQACDWRSGFAFQRDWCRQVKLTIIQESSRPHGGTQAITRQVLICVRERFIRIVKHWFWGEK